MHKITKKGFNELSKKLERIPVELQKGLRLAVQNSMLEFDGEMQKRLRGGALGLNVKEAALSRSLHTVTEGKTLNDIKGVTVIGGTAAPHAKIQEYGGTLRARLGKYLAVPVGAALTGGLRLKEKLAGFLRDVPNVDIFKSKKGNIVVVRRFYKSKKSKRQSGEVIAVLKESVTLKPRLQFFNTWKALAAPRKARLELALKRAMAWKPSGGGA